MDGFSNAWPTLKTGSYGLGLSGTRLPDQTKRPSVRQPPPSQGTSDESRHGLAACRPPSTRATPVQEPNIEATKQTCSTAPQSNLEYRAQSLITCAPPPQTTPNPSSVDNILKYHIRLLIRDGTTSFCLQTLFHPTPHLASQLSSIVDQFCCFARHAPCPQRVESHAQSPCRLESRTCLTQIQHTSHETNSYITILSPQRPWQPPGSANHQPASTP